MSDEPKSSLTGDSRHLQSAEAETASGPGRKAVADHGTLSSPSASDPPSAPHGEQSKAEERRGCGVVLWIVLAPVLYLGSLFPVVWSADALMARGVLPRRATIVTVDTIYAPIGWIMRRSPQFARAIRSGLPPRR